MTLGGIAIEDVVDGMKANAFQVTFPDEGEFVLGNFTELSIDLGRTYSTQSSDFFANIAANSMATIYAQVAARAQESGSTNTLVFPEENEVIQNYRIQRDCLIGQGVRRL